MHTVSIKINNINTNRVDDDGKVKVYIEALVRIDEKISFIAKYSTGLLVMAPIKGSTRMPEIAREIKTYINNLFTVYVAAITGKTNLFILIDGIDQNNNGRDSSCNLEEE